MLGSRRTTLVLAVFALALACSAAPIHAQDLIDGRKQAQAARVPSGSIRLDGRLDDENWRRVSPVVDFVQTEPVEGAAPSSPMEIRFAYDDDALYIGARMAGAPGGIQAPLSRRDEGQQAESIQIEFDTFLDRRTAYMFGVTASGVRLDHYHSTDNEDNVDRNFDPVWRAETRTDEAGWTAELWIPFSQLRFIDQAERVWGLNIKRYIPSTNEEVYWAPVLRTERGWSSRFGDLRGIDGVSPKARLEILPYTAGTSLMRGNRDEANPFDSRLNLKEQVGADVKIGVGSNLTLDATINPDFGQVEADPAEVNLTTNETFFDEQRTFFREGENLLNGNANQFYYSRRIGAPPSGPATGEFVDYPRTTRILGAAKLTGRLASGTSLGILGAVTDDAYARSSTAGFESRTRVASRTVWGLSRFDQEFGREGSTIGFGLVGMQRNSNPDDPLSALQTKRAIAGSGDGQIRFGNRTYEANFTIGFSHVTGQPAALERIQKTTVHMFQSPDRDGVELDPTRTEMSGGMIQASLDKVAGRHWLWGSQISAKSPGLETNDFGRLNNSGEIRIQRTSVTWRQTTPGRYFRAYSFTLAGEAKPWWGAWAHPRSYLAPRTDVTFRNFWVGRVAFTRNLRGQDWLLTRGGPTMGTPRAWRIEGSLRNANSAANRWQGQVAYEESEDGDSTFEWSSSGISFRPAPRWYFSIAPKYSAEVVQRQYVTSIAGGRPETFGRRYVFGVIDRTTLSSQFRVAYVFKPDMTLDVYAEPFAASGRYDSFGELSEPGSRELVVYGEDGTTFARNPDGKTTVTDATSTFSFTRRDFNIRSFRSNVVLRWEWRPGSTLYVVWQQDRSSEETYGDHVGAGDLFGSFSAPGNNFFVVKTTFWISR